MRIQNSLKNMFFGLSGQIISVIMGFIVRTVFINTLGIEYLGVDGLFSSILMMLSLANLGFDTAMIYSLYKPLAENDNYRIQALMNLYQKAYRYVGVVVLLIGLVLLPFLSNLMNGKTTINHINLIYLLFLLSSVSSYFFVYKQSLLIADQRNYVISKVHSIFTLIANSFQIILLFLIGNYILVLITQIGFRILENIFLAKKVDGLYPFLNEKNDAVLSRGDKNLFFQNLYALLLYKISGVVINGTDNIVISKFVGITWVGLYSNYFLIISTLNTFLGYLFYSVTASVGNVVVKENTQKKYFVFRVLNFLNAWIYGFSAVSLWILINPFINIWLGERYIFNKYIVFFIVLNFFTTGMQNASTTYRDTTGLFKKGKYRPIIAAGINIVVSIILAKNIGIAGVFIGTIFSRLCTYFWYDPYVLFNYVFKSKIKGYFIKYMLFSLLATISAIIIDTIGSLIIFNSTLINFLIRASLCIVVPNTIFFIFFRKSEEFNYLWNILRKVINLGSWYEKFIISRV